MKDKYTLLRSIGWILILSSLLIGCNTNNETQLSPNGSDTITSDSVAVINASDSIASDEQDYEDGGEMDDPPLNPEDSLAVMKAIANSVPKEYKMLGFWTWGDFDSDGRMDYMVIVKGTKEENFVECEWQEDSLIDRNPRGYVLVMNRDDQYVVTSYNYECFPSENEDGGVYFPPELYIEYYHRTHVLDVTYSHGRYGSWSFYFKYRDGDFVLVKDCSDESLSWITETVYWECVDYEKLIKTCSKLQNPDEVAEDGASPVYKEWEEEVEHVKIGVKMSEREQWFSRY